MVKLNNKIIIDGFKRLVHSKSTPKAKVFIYQNPFDGFPKETDLKLVEEDLPPLKDGEFLAEAEYLSLDPYMRGFGPKLNVGTTMIGSQVAKNTAFFGFREVLKAKPGETVMVTGAAGAVGSYVGQIAKSDGCKVIGVTGSDEKGKWLTNELKFDGFINYKTDDVHKVLKEMAPEGIDCFFDNVGGELFNIILRNMKIAVCGAIAGYNAKGEPKRTLIEFDHRQQVRIEGFQVFRFSDRWLEGIQQNMKLIKEGKLKYREIVTYGFHNMFKAFTDMLTGGNIGKAVVKI